MAATLRSPTATRIWAPDSRAAVNAQAWLDQTPFFYRGTDAVAPQRNRYDYPNPLIAGRLTPPVGDQMPPLLTAVPFHLSDWPVPRGYTPANPLKTWTLSGTLYIGRDSFPATYKFDWKNPLVAGRLLPEVGPPVLPSRIPVPPPFSLTYWPNPIVAGRLNPGWAHGSTIRQSAGAKPFLLNDQPVPIRDGRLSLGGALYSLSIGRIVPVTVVFQPGLIRQILSLEQTQKQINNALTELTNQLPGYGTALPDVSLYAEGKIFVVTTTGFVYQVQGGVWVRIK